MGVIKTKGIVLAQHNMSDDDAMITILTPNLGKIGCAARGVRRPKSALMAGTQFLCFGDFIIYKGINSYTINSCEPIEIFYNIRLDIDKLKYATEITKIASEVTDENENCYNILQLLLNTIYVISETDKDLDLVLSVFKLRLLSIIGFRPTIEKCCNCRKNENLMYFSLKDGGLKCENCGRLDKGAIEVSKGTVKAIKYIIWSESKKLYSFDISDENKKQLKLMTKLYLDKCLDKEFE